MKTILILTAARCNKCPEVLKYMHEKVSGYDLKFIPSGHPDFMANVEAHNAVSAPTVILFGEKKKDNSMDELGRAHDVEGIKELLDKHK